MHAARLVEPEWLDHLPPEDPRAARSRRDLVRINALMGNARIVAGELAKAGPLHSIAEIGAGDGAFMRAVLKRLGPGSRQVLLVDRQPLAPEVIAADVFEWLEGCAPVDAIVANLFLHHFEGEPLARMLKLIARRTRLFVACEPRRATVALAGAHLLGLAGCNDVSRHDSVVSVRAGFAGRELSALWPHDPAWQCEEGGRGLFSHAFVARRR